MSEGGPPRLAVVAGFAAVYFIWGSTYLGIRYAVETIPPFLMAGARFLLAGAVLYAVARPLSGERPTRVHWRSAAVIGALLLVGGNGVLSWAEKVVPSGIAALLVATVPLFMVLHGWSWGGTGPPSVPVALGLVGGFAGVALLLSPEVGVPDPAYATAALAIVGAAFLWAGGSIYSRNAPLPESQLLGVAMEMLAGGAMLALVGLALGEGAAFDAAAVSTRSLAALAYLVVFGSLIAFTCYLWILKVSTPARVSTYAYVNPVVAVALGWALAGEPVTARTLVAAAVIIGSVALITMRRAREPDAGQGADPSNPDDGASPTPAPPEGVPGHRARSTTERLRLLLSPEERLEDAERRFFRAYEPGGAAEDHDLVLPPDFWRRREVRGPLLAWLRAGELPPVAAIEIAWGGGDSIQETVAFHENVGRFFELLEDPHSTPPVPDAAAEGRRSPAPGASE